MKTNVLRGLDLAGIEPKHIRYEDFHHPPHLEHPLLPEVEVSAEYRENRPFHLPPQRRIAHGSHFGSRVECPASLSRVGCGSRRCVK